MLRVLYVLLLLSLAGPAQAQFHQRPAAPDTLADRLDDAYRIYRPDGQPATLEDIVAAMAAADVVFLGEQHDDRIGHALQARLLGQAYLHYGAPTVPDARPLALSLEMFERDVQPILDEYLAGLITEQQFRRSSRPWPNYEADYQPMVEFARAHGLPVLAANAPRRYVNRVSRLGPAALDSLSGWAKTWLPPLPYPGPSPAYEARWQQMMAEMMAEMAAEHPAAPADPADSTAHPSVHPALADTTAEAMPHAAMADTTAEAAALAEGPHGGGHNQAHMLDAQALWDAAMADALRRHLDEVPGALVVHMVGGFHVEAGLGTPAQLGAYRPDTRSLLIVMQAGEDLDAFDAETHADLGDFIILTKKPPSEAPPAQEEEAAGEAR